MAAAIAYSFEAAWLNANAFIPALLGEPRHLPAQLVADRQLAQVEGDKPKLDRAGNRQTLSAVGGRPTVSSEAVSRVKM